MLALLALLALAACGDASAPGGPALDAEGAVAERFDLPRIRRRGTLRILVPRDAGAAHLPRAGSPLEAERDLAAAFAEDLDLEPEWVWVDSYEALIPKLLAGEGDLIADNLTVTPERRGQVAFSVAVAIAREQVVTRADDESLSSPEQLEGRTFRVRRSSSYWGSLRDLRREYPSFEIEAASEEASVDEILEQVAKGEADLTLADSNLVDGVFAYRDDLRVAFDLGRDVVMAWALRPDAIDLRRAADAFLIRVRTRSARREQHVDDLPGIRERGVIRVLTRNNASTYYIWRGQLMGFEYDLAREFARREGLRMELVVPPSRDDLIPWLLQGKGDLIAAGLSASDARAAAAGVRFSRLYNEVRETIVARADDPSVQQIEDLAGRRVVVRRGSAYWATLEGLRAGGIPLDLIAAPDELETEEVIARVAEGEYDLTLADSHILAIALAWRDDVRAAIEIEEPVFHGWAVRPDSVGLLDAIDSYFRKEYRGTFFNVTARKYFAKPERIRQHASERALRNGRISRWDDQIRREAAAYGFDWRLIAAQMYQESRFDPLARSFAGAAGLLQILPRTARQVGVEDPHDPESGISAGVRYLAWTRDRFPTTLPPDEREWFALAAYNAGPGHVNDARRIAVEEGLDPERWFGQVETAMLLKRKPEYARHSRFGYCRCGEPVNYVREIRDRYEAYTRVAGH
jgi:membrane-bound lytic murein transglycosylase F